MASAAVLEGVGGFFSKPAPPSGSPHGAVGTELVSGPGVAGCLAQATCRARHGYFSCRQYLEPALEGGAMMAPTLLCCANGGLWVLCLCKCNKRSLFTCPIALPLWGHLTLLMEEIIWWGDSRMYSACGIRPELLHVLGCPIKDDEQGKKHAFDRTFTDVLIGII